MQTRGGRLLADNPPAATAGDVVATVESAVGSGVGEVREITGGDTGLALVLDRPTVIYGRQLTVSGRVVRGGAPSAGEVVFAHGLADRSWRSTEPSGSRSRTSTVASRSGSTHVNHGLGRLVARAAGRQPAQLTRLSPRPRSRSSSALDAPDSERGHAG